MKLLVLESATMYLCRCIISLTSLIFLVDEVHMDFARVQGVDFHLQFLPK